MRRCLGNISFALLPLLASPALAGYQWRWHDTTSVEAGLRLVVQYRDLEQTDNGEASDDNTTELRRLRPYLKWQNATWQAKISWEASDRKPNTVKDLFLAYNGLEHVQIKLGNDNLPFSRERMTSSAKQNTPERLPAGENNWGVPGRQLGVFAEYQANRRWQLFAALARADVYSDGFSEIRFVSPLSNTDLVSDALAEGWIAATRADYSLGKPVKYQQADFNRKPGATFSAAAYRWQADDPEPGLYDHYADAQGLELSLAARGHGFAFDCQYLRIEASIDAARLSADIKAVLPGDPPQLTHKLLHNNRAALSQLSAELGYMLVADQLEIVTAWQRTASDAEGEAANFASGSTWAGSWQVNELGANYYFDKQRHKVQLSYRDETQVQGKDRTIKGIFLQWQYDY